MFTSILLCYIPIVWLFTIHVILCIYIYTHALFLLHATGPYYSSVRIQWETQGLEISGQDMHFKDQVRRAWSYHLVIYYYIISLFYNINPIEIPITVVTIYHIYIYISQAMGITVTLQFKSQLRYISPVTWILIWYTLIPIRKNNSKLDPKFSIHYITHNMSVSENGVYWIFFL